MGSFKEDLAKLINSYSLEQGSDTPDWILAQYMQACLEAFGTAMQQRESWYGRKVGDADND